MGTGSPFVGATAGYTGSCRPRVLFRQRHGVVVALPLPTELATDELRSALRDEERAMANTWAARRVRTFAGGRIALRVALRECGFEVPGPILHTPRGAPLLPVGVRASVSHTDELAIAIASLDDGSGAFIGVDVELFEDPHTCADPQPVDVSRHILTEPELRALATLDESARHRELITRFSLKESLYKALDPFVNRDVDFLEVEVEPTSDGSASFALALVGREGPFHVDAVWALIDDPSPGIVSSVRVRHL